MKPLHQELRNSTGGVHTRAENHAFMQGLIRLKCPRARYGIYLRSLLELYQALEHAMDVRKPVALLMPFQRAELRRVSALRKDLQDLFPNTGNALVPVAPARRAAHGLEKAEEDELAAMAYVRYFGDLAGGRMLAPLVEKAYAAGPQHGTRFYRFEGCPEHRDRDRLLQMLRKDLDAVSLSGEDRKRFLDHAVRAFEVHLDLFDALMEVDCDVHG